MAAFEQSGCESGWQPVPCVGCSGAGIIVELAVLYVQYEGPADWALGLIAGLQQEFDVNLGVLTCGGFLLNFDAAFGATAQQSDAGDAVEVGFIKTHVRRPVWKTGVNWSESGKRMLVRNTKAAGPGFG